MKKFLITLLVVSCALFGASAVSASPSEITPTELPSRH